MDLVVTHYMLVSLIFVPEKKYSVRRQVQVPARSWPNEGQPLKIWSGHLDVPTIATQQNS